MRHQNAYAWFVFLSAMDLMLTWIILHSNGREVNPVADWVVTTLDLWGLVGFKFSLVVLVVVLCEMIGPHRPALAQFVSCFAVIITAVPVGYAFFLLLRATI